MLNVYSMGAELLEPVGLGLHHSGLEVHGKEWTFSSGGVFSHTPRQAPGVKFSHAIVIADIRMSSKKVEDIVRDLRSDYPGSSYNLLNKNCNIFANDLAVALTGKSVPGYVNRLARLGKCFSCLLPQSLRGQSPVNEFDSVGSSGGRYVRRGVSAPSAFTGAGRSLSSSTSPSTSSSSSSSSSSSFSTSSAKLNAAERRRLQAAAAARRLSSNSDTNS